MLLRMRADQLSPGSHAARIFRLNPLNPSIFTHCLPTGPKTRQRGGFARNALLSVVACALRRRRYPIGHERTLRSCRRSPMPKGRPLRANLRTGAMDAPPAQSLKPTPLRQSEAALASRRREAGRAAARGQRLARRFIAALVAREPPRGLGASAAALLLLACTCYGVVKGGHTETIVAQVQDICDSAANSAGFRISEVRARRPA